MNVNIFLLFQIQYIKTGTVTIVQRAWRTEFKNEPAPSTSVIRHINSTFKKTGSVISAHQPNAGKSNKREEAEILQEKGVSKNPSVSINKLACVADISYSLARTVLRDDLGIKSYKIQSVQKLLPVDYAKRVNFAEYYILQSEEVQENMYFSERRIFISRYQ